MIKVLIIDDHQILREGVIQLLGSVAEIACVDQASDAMDAYKLIWQHEYDVVLLDISLPGRNGLEFLKDLKVTHPAMAVLILSMHPEERYAVRAIKAGASGYLTKSSASFELVEAVKIVAGGGKYITESVAGRIAEELRYGNSSSHHAVLSDREFQVMCMIASGNTVSEIAAQLSLSVKTISTHRCRILEKMNLRHNAQLTHYAFQEGLVD
jgi:DNA-binding NarL/FixJ family response regulator